MTVGWRGRLRRVLPDALGARYDLLRGRMRYGRRRRRAEAGVVDRPGRGRRILFHPELPGHRHIIWKMAAELGFRMVQRGPADAVVRFETATTSTPDGAMLARARRQRVINLHCSDISKSHVNAVFEKVFGYPLGIDPEQHVGVAVAKSEVNAAHDGRIVTCPCPRERGVSYQRLIDDTAPDRNHTTVLRTPIVGAWIPLVFAKRRPIGQRLSDVTADVEVLETRTVFSQAEQQLLLDFARELGMDVGELDVLRDRGDGRIYVVDANSTPWGPPVRLIEQGREAAVLARLAPAYAELFLPDHDLTPGLEAAMVP